MDKLAFYHTSLLALDDWDDFLLQESHLPGPRGNLELAHVVADLGDAQRFEHFLTFTPELAPVNSPSEFLAFCGVLGLGKLALQNRKKWIGVLRNYASDPRWRTREAVAMALQRVGKADMDALLHEIQAWQTGNFMEQRAVVAALAEPILLKNIRHADSALQILDQITLSLAEAENRQSEAFRVLRQGLGYGWSVIVTATPEKGKQAMEKWCLCDDKDITWIMKENLKKNRLRKMDEKWVEKWAVITSN